MTTARTVVASLLVTVLHVTTPAAAAPVIERVAGTDRVETAIALAEDAFEEGAEVAVVASAATFVDALAAAPLAAAADGPTLLNPPERLDPRVGDALRRLGVQRVLLMGGTAAQSATVEDDLRDVVGSVARIAGTTRFETAGAAARRAVQLWRDAGDETAGQHVLIALGAHPDPSRAWPDALAAGVLGGTGGAPVLLVTPDHLPAATRDAIAALGAERATLAGGPGAVSEAVVAELEVPVERIAGASRYATAARLAAAAVEAGADPGRVTIATGADFADALAAGPATVARGGVLLLVPPGDLDAAPGARDGLRASGLERAVIAGGTRAVPAPVAGQIRRAVTGFDAPGLVLRTVYTSPDSTPLGVVALPGIGPVVFERGGRVATLDGRELADLSPRVRTDGERGLLGVAAHPGHAANGRLFVHYSRRSDGATVVAELRRSGDAIPLSSERVLLTLPQPASNHNGGTLTVGPDGMLYLFLGDGGGSGDQFDTGQTIRDDPATPYDDARLGAVLRMDVSVPGRIGPAPGNPFRDRAGDDWLWAYGLRNPFRAAFDAVAGTLFIADVGQGSWEEVDAVPVGEGGHNFGWSVTEGDHCFRAESCERDGLTPPVLEYPTHEAGTCGIIGGHPYRGGEAGEASGMLRGHYFYGDLCAGFVRSFRLVDGRAAERTTWDSLALDSVLSFGTDGAGRVYVMDARSVHLIEVTSP